MRQSRFLFWSWMREMKLYLIFALIDLLILIAYPLAYLYHKAHKVLNPGNNKRK